MNVALLRTMTAEEFLAWEKRQELRHEFDGVRPLAMTGGTEAHAAIQINLVTALRTRLRGGPCRAYGSDLKVSTSGSIRYPDAFVVCNRPARHETVAREPVVIFEILSPSTTNQDLIVKNREYRGTPSVQRYVVLEQTHAAAIVFSRAGDLWTTETASGPDATLELPEIGITIPLADIYAEVTLASDENTDIA